MPLFGKSKKAQEAKKQEEAAAPKPAAYRHVPKHAASDARNHGLADGDRTAQQKRIMAASQSRINSMSSSYSIKSNFNDVPINGSQSKPLFFSASNSPRSSIGNTKGKDRLAVQPASPADTVQPSQEAKDEYVKPRNPGLLPNTTAHRSPSPQPTYTAKNQATAGGVDSSDSGYGSVGQVSKPNSKAPSTISKAPTENRQSQEVRFATQTSTGLDFLPKLDFAAEASQPPIAERAPSPVQVLKPAAVIASRERATSSSSSYVSRLDPGSDRRSIASSSSKPFDQIDFSKPGQQFVPASVTETSRTDPDPVVTARSRTPVPQVQAPAQEPVHEPRKYRNVQQSPLSERRDQPERPAHQYSENHTTPRPPHISNLFQEAERCRGLTQSTTQNVASRPQHFERSDSDTLPTLQLTRDHMINKKTGAPPVHSTTEEGFVPPQVMQSLPAQPLPASSVDDERGRQTPPPVPTSVPQSDRNVRNSSSSRTRQSEQSRQQGTRHRNWSRPSQPADSQLDPGSNQFNGEMSETSVPTQAPASHTSDYRPENFDARQLSTDTRDFYRTEHTQAHTRPAQIEQPVQSQYPQKWNDQASSIYGESVYNPSTRQHSPSRRPSLAPSEVFEYGPSAAKTPLPPLGILDGLRVNKRGKILDEEGDPIGELVEGEIIDCVRQRVNAFGQVLDDYGRIVGRVSTTSRGGTVGSQHAAAMAPSRSFHDSRPDVMQRYTMPESQIVSPTTPTLARPFEYTQEEDPRQRAAHLQAAAARQFNRGPDAHIELDGSGYAEAAPLVDHSEIFAPPFIPSRSPKRSPAEPETHTMDHYFVKPPERSQPPPEEPPRLKKWASRNLEQEREEMQSSKQAPAVQPVEPPSDHTVSRPSTTETQSTQRNSTVLQSEPDAAAQNFISSDQPKDIFPWMTTSAQQGSGKWSPNVFTYKGEVPSEDATKRQSTPAARGAMSQQQAQIQSAFPGNGALPKHYAAQLAASGGTRKSNRTSFREHQPHVKSPLSTHSKRHLDHESLRSTANMPPDITPPDSSGGDSASTPRPGSHNTIKSTATANTSSNQPPPGLRQKTYFTHAGRTSVMVPDTRPTHTGSTEQLTQTVPSNSSAAEPPPSPLDSAVPPDVARTKTEQKRRSRWSMGFDKFAQKKAPPVQNLLKKS